jgi:phosphate transport system substrate-binding protein
VSDIIEIKFGYDCIVVARSAEMQPISLTRRDIYLALARWIPGLRNGDVVANPNRTWQDVNPSLPDLAIEVFGPPPTSGTRDAFVEVAMEAGCQATQWVRALQNSDTMRYYELCHTIREDGAFVEAGENDNVIVHKLVANPGAFGIFGFNFLDQNGEKVNGASIDGVEPSADTIASGEYPISRPLFFYVKKTHVRFVPGLRRFLGEITSERAWGDQGYLADRGLVPLPIDERRRIATSVRELTTLASSR